MKEVVDITENRIQAAAPRRRKVARICFLLSRSSLCIQSNYFIYQRKLLILEFIFNILLYNVRIFSDKFKI